MDIKVYDSAFLYKDSVAGMAPTLCKSCNVFVTEALREEEGGFLPKVECKGHFNPVGDGDLSTVQGRCGYVTATINTLEIVNVRGNETFKCEIGNCPPRNGFETIEGNLIGLGFYFTVLGVAAIMVIKMLLVERKEKDANGPISI